MPRISALRSKQGVTDKLHGLCLCGGVVFSFPREDLKSADACHCSQCRRWSGYLWGSINAPFEAVTFTSRRTLKWYRASDYAQRGFCAECGASLFWHGDKLDDHKDRIAIALGALDAPTDIKIAEH
ncbi:MAG: GFA family protein, partial [Alphaproteobacteria bacterium]|nr:GFA family protein [Alphaproteobacteria bacterium]